MRGLEVEASLKEDAEEVIVDEPVDEDDTEDSGEEISDDSEE